jgi:hypothetical protein
MSKSVAAILVLLFMIALCIAIKPVLSSADTSENSWVSKSPMHQARARLGVAVVNGKIYAIGGIVLKYQDRFRTESVEVATNEEYDPATDTWTTKASMPTEVGGYSGVFNDKIYVIGSRLEQGYYDELDHYVRSNRTSFSQVYDPATDAWSTGASPPILFKTAYVGVTTGVMAPKRIYVFNNPYTAPNASLHINQVYYPETDSWASGAAVPTCRQGFATAVVDDLIYVIGGFAITYPDISYWSTGGVLNYFATVEQYTPFGYGTPDPSSSSTNTPPNTEPESFPTALVATASGASVAIIGVGLLVYFKKRNH